MNNISFEQLNKTEIHQSAITLVIKVVLLEVFFIFFNVAFVLTDDLIKFSFGSGFPLFTGTIVAVVLMLIRLFIIGKMILSWLRTYWVIGKDKISFFQGVIDESKEEYRISNIEYISVRQSFVGKRLNYGTVEMSMPILNKKVHMVDIPYPHFFAGILGEMISNKTNSDRIIYREGILKG